MSIEIGKTYSVLYPFVLRDVDVAPDDPEAAVPKTIKSWCPGVEWERNDPYSDADACADALGEMLLTVIDIHKPGRFPVRVFYTRQWKDPNGHTFGKGALRIATMEKFRRLAKGYQHEVYIDGDIARPHHK